MSVPPSVPPPRNNFGKFVGAGMQMLVIIAVFTFGGYWLDGHQGWSPWGTLVGSLLGIFLALYQVIKAVTRE